MVNIENFLFRQVESLHSIIEQNEGEIPESDLYSNITNNYLRYLFSGIHNHLNLLFKFMNDKSKFNQHFNAQQSRELLNIIEILDKMNHYLGKTDLNFSLIETYKNHLEYSSTFLKESSGSQIPLDYKDIFIIEYEPVFLMEQTINIEKGLSIDDINFPLQVIGQGSYARVSKFTDTFYDISFAVKTALPNLTPKELERFKKEFLTMIELDSPYIIKAYKYNDKKNEYIMELANYTIKKYLEINSNMSFENRRGLAVQILRAFEYLHSKNKYHRDISYTNILVKVYEDVEIIKISDFGLVKEPSSTLTSKFTEMKGVFNDPNLEFIGFENYSIQHETYALVRLLYFVMTNRTNISKSKNKSQEDFLTKGLNIDESIRYQSVAELKEAFLKVQWHS